MILREYLIRKKLTYEDFAVKIGISKRTLIRLMNGQSDPTLSLAKKIVDATSGKVSYDEIITPEDSD